MDPRASGAGLVFVLSGGERRVLSLVCALTNSTPTPVDITDIVTGIDHHHLGLALTALAHAGGAPVTGQQPLAPVQTPTLAHTL